MNLLIFIHSLNSGGAERVSANLANYWAGRGWRVTVVTLASSESDFYQLHPAVRRIGLDVAGRSGSVAAGAAANLRRVAALRRVLRELQPDVALAMMSTANVLLALATFGMTAVIALGSEHTYPPMIPLGRVWEELRSRLYGRLDAVVALTSESERWLQEHTSARRVPVIPNPAPWPLPIQAPTLSPPPRGDGRYMLLAVGRLGEEKGFHRLLDAFQQLADAFPDWRLVILGEGSERQALEAQVAAAGLHGRVSLPGRAGNVGQWYEAADLYVMSSRFEGFPNTLAEAMAHGLPAVSFDCDTGPRDIIRHEVDGLLVPAADVPALASALRRLMADEDLRQRFGERAREARERFSMARVAGMWEALFQDLLQRHCHAK